MVLPGLVGALAAGLGGAGLEAVSSYAPPVVLPIGVAYTRSTDVPVVRVQVVGGPELRLVLDTGSTGVIVYQNRLSSMRGFEPTGYDFPGFSFADGTSLYGSAYYVRLRFGRDGPTSSEMPVEIASSLVCATGTTCGTAQTEEGVGAYGVDGILGIGTETDSGGLPNPLRMLSPPYDRYWQVSIAPAGVGGSLSLGTNPDSPSWEIPMRALGVDHWGEEWRAVLQGCWTFKSADKWCVPTVLDTGTSALVLTGHPPGLLVVSAGGSDAIAVEDQGWTISLDDRVLVAQSTSENYPVLVQHRGPDNISTVGVHALGGLTVGYNLAQGLITIVRTGPGQ
ncbi:MAG TPA: hypothetical protein VHU17_17900 [Acidimicrobiales bacterium]|nr:hypothetical protein [Acidimicrobiales bacterium]